MGIGHNPRPSMGLPGGTPSPSAAVPDVTPPPTDAATVTSAQIDLDRAVLPTEIPKWLAWTMAVAFGVGIAVIPAVQIYLEATGKQRSQLSELFTRPPTRENLHQYENDVARNSVAKQAVQPQAQLALSRYQGFGNTNVLIGHDGWLFYRPGVSFLTGRGILDETRLRLRAKKLAAAGEKSSPDPRPAILAFHEACKASGVHLILVPIPDKAMLQPGELTGRLAGSTTPPTNADYAKLLAELRAAGVDVFDPTPTVLTPGEPPRFLKQDTHWTPEWMDTVARDLSAHIRAKVPQPATVSFRTEETRVRRVGDLVDMLELPPDQNLFEPQEVVIRRVIDGRTGAAWQPAPAADVILLGDSFTNIYMAKEMGWGDAAGFGPQLARHLGRDVDVIALNGSGASGTRKELARRGLGGKKVVVWEFAVRELMEGNWDVVPMPAGAANDTKSATPEPPLKIEATIVATSKVPKPFSVPYADCLTYTKMRIDRVIEGAYTDSEIIAVMWGMKGNVLQPAAGYKPGQKLTLKLIPLRQASLDYQSIRRADDLDDFEHRPYLVIEEAKP